MIFELTKQERERLEVLQNSYDRLLEETRLEIERLAPGPAPVEDLSRAAFEEWLASGTDEWRAARERETKLIREKEESINSFLQGVYDSHFARVAKRGAQAIVKSARQEIDAAIEKNYAYYERVCKTGINEYGMKVLQFQARDVRSTGKGFFLDSSETMKHINTCVIDRHLEALKNDPQNQSIINQYLVKAIASSPYISSTEGVRFAPVIVEIDDNKQQSSDDKILAVRPDNYVTTVDRVSRKVFENRLTAPLDADVGALYDVRLDQGGKVFVRVAINYQELLDKGELLALPQLTDKDYSVHDAICTLLAAGNRVMSYDMIYRAMTGKVTGKIELTDEALKTIDTALDKFRGNFKLRYTPKDNDEVADNYDEPLVTFQRLTRETKINGKIVKGGIRIPDDTKFDPPLLRWARKNRSEIDTRDITLLDVPRLNNGDESFTLKMCLYRRLIAMKNIFERKKGKHFELTLNERTIRYDYVYAALGLSGENMTKDKRHDLKDKIERCLSYWKSKGFIADYNHKKDKSNGNQFYAVVIDFLPPTD